MADVERPSGGRRDVLKQWALVLGAVGLYFGVRGRTSGEVGLATRHGLDVLALERRLGVDVELGVQGFIIDHHWMVTLANWVYIWGHWPIITLVLVWLFRTRRVDYLRLRNAMFVSGAIGLVIFMSYPVAPPRLLGVGFQDTVTALSNSYRVLQPPALVNKYAAVPSLHVGWNLLVGIALFRASRRWMIRVLGVVGPAAMATAVVLTANHYVVDAVAGAAVALTGLLVSSWLTPRVLSTERPRRTLLRPLPAASAVASRNEGGHLVGARIPSPANRGEERWCSCS